MPSPIGHLLGGAAVYLAGTRPELRSRRMLVVTLLASMVPDLDFLPGIAIGETGAFHHGISHSVGFAVLFGAMVYLFLRRVEGAIAVWTAILGFCGYLSHVVLDLLAVSEGTRGVPILWPFSSEQIGFSLNLFDRFRWGDIQEGVGAIIRRDNVMPVLRETLVMGSIVLLLLLRERRPLRRNENRSE
jgi:inner membrane protein